MTIKFTKHAEDKFEVLRRHGVKISKEKVSGTIRKPDVLNRSRILLIIAQGEFYKRRVLRVVYKIEEGIILVITFYPGRKTQYEKS